MGRAPQQYPFQVSRAPIILGVAGGFGAAMMFLLGQASPPSPVAAPASVHSAVVTTDPRCAGAPTLRAWLAGTYGVDAPTLSRALGTPHVQVLTDSWLGGVLVPVGSRKVRLGTLMDRWSHAV